MNSDSDAYQLAKRAMTDLTERAVDFMGGTLTTNIRLYGKSRFMATWFPHDLRRTAGDSDPRIVDRVCKTAAEAEQAVRDILAERA